MENEKIETNAENNKNQQNSNSEVKPRNKKVTIVLVSVIIVLLIAIGVCAGLWFAGDTTKIINNKEEVVKEEENTSKQIHQETQENRNLRHFIYKRKHLRHSTVEDLGRIVGTAFIRCVRCRQPANMVNHYDSEKQLQRQGLG